MGICAEPFDDIVLSADEFVEAWAAHERNAARLALAARRLEVCGDWASDGSVSMAAWLRHRCRMSNRDAAALVHRGRFLDKFTDIAEAACTGVLSAGQVTADIGSSTTDAFLCDCVIHRVLRAGNSVLSYGRATRAVPLDLFRAVAARDGGCRFPGCDRKVAWCDAHHIRYWRHLGVTDLENLTLLCSRHHHLIHRPGWHLKLLPDGDLEVTYPNGATRTSQPRGQPARSP